jgi:hypothetical protein
MMSARVHDADSLDAFEAVLQACEPRACRRNSCARMGPVGPCILHMGPVAVGSGLVWDPRETQVPLWDPFVSKLVPDETHSSSKLGGGSGFKASILKSPRPLAPEP